MKILLVEDSPIIRCAYISLLKAHAHHVDWAADGKEALAKFKHSYDIVLMDIDLPHLNGIELTYKLRKLYSSQRSALKKSCPSDVKRKPAKQPIIIGITVDLTDTKKHLCLEAGMNTVIDKERGFHALLTLIEQYSSSR